MCQIPRWLYFDRGKGINDCRLYTHGNKIEQLNEFVYFGSLLKGMKLNKEILIYAIVC